MTTFEIACFVEITQAAAAKVVMLCAQEFRKEQNLVIIFIVAAVFVFLPLIMTAVIFVFLIWTRRPDLSVEDILREAVKEKKSKAGKNRQKGKEYEQDYHL